SSRRCEDASSAKVAIKSRNPRTKPHWRLRMGLGSPPSTTALPNWPPAMTSKPNSLVLLIEDEPEMRSFLRSGFEVHGFSVVEAQNAADGLKIAAFNPLDLVILDLGLPDMHGSEALERLRSWSNVPVIALSAESNEDEMVSLL